MWHDLEEASERWIAAQDAKIGALDPAAEAAATAAGAEGSVYRRAVKMLEAGGAELREVDAVFADEPKDSGPLLGQKPRRPEDFDEDCLSDSWVASDRLAWIDLTAGPFTWGPSAGGVGARTHATLPSVSEMVEDYYTPVDDTYEQPQGGTDQEGFLDFVNQIQAERDVVHMLHKRHCAGWRSRSASAAEAKVEGAHDPHMRDAGDARPTPPSESFAGRPDLCEEILARQQRLEALLGRAESVEDGPDPAEGPPKPAEKLSAMQAELKAMGGDEDNPIFTRGMLGNTDLSFAIDRSLAHLGAVISNTLRLLVTPVAAGPDSFPSVVSEDDKAGGDEPQLFAERVAFHIFTITEHAISEPDVLVTIAIKV